MDALRASSGVLSIFLLIAVGFLAAKLGHISEDTEQKLAKLAYSYAAPALIVYSTVTELTPELIAEKLGIFILLPAVTIAAGYALAHLLARVFRLSADERGAMSAMFSMSNVIFIGVPVCLSVFGPWTTPYVVSVLPSNTILFWTLGNLGMSAHSRAGSKTPDIPQLLKQVFSPPLVAFLLSLPFVMLRITFPGFLLSGVQMLSGLATPLALLTVGSVLARMDKRLFKVPAMSALALAGRHLVMPLLTFAVCRLCGAPSELVIVYTVVAGMPVMSQAVIVARRNNCCVEQVAQSFALSSLCMLIGVPLMIALLQYII